MPTLRPLTHPRITAVSGPLEGQRFEIGDGPFSIGRLSSNDLQLREITVSRRHCVFERDGDRCRVRDLGSHLGTFVNGLPVKTRRLSHGDFVKVAGTLFLYLEKETGGEADALTPAPIAEGDWVASSTIRISAADAVEHHRRKLRAALDPETPAAERLETFFDVAAAIAEARDVEELGERLLEQIQAALPAERATALLADRGEGERVIAQRGRVDDRPVLSRSVARRVMAEGEALLANDLMRGGGGGKSGVADADSVRAARLASLLCAPMLHAGAPVGALYADSRDPEARFDEEHLRWLAALAALAAPAFEGALRTEWLEGENRRLRAAELDHDLVGESEAMRKLLRLLGRVAPTDSTVLLRGESGTGKELVARAIHRNSPRVERPFVAINCATLSETLLESELFGHERGAFTGAVARQIGKLEIADGGTVFLDEVGEIPVALQAKLLRVLEERAFERVGGARAIEVDVRVVAATNRDLEAAIEDGGFRRDLYYRLNVITLELPPLRERRDDVPLLAGHFAAMAARGAGREVAGLTPAARESLAAYDWPGNVRELKNAIERAVVLGEGELIRPEDLPEAVLESGSEGGAPTTYHEAVNAAKRRAIRDALEASGGSVAGAARRLGLHRNYLHRLIRNLGLREG